MTFCCCLDKSRNQTCGAAAAASGMCQSWLLFSRWGSPSPHFCKEVFYFQRYKRAIKRLTHMFKCVIVELRLRGKENICFACKDVGTDNEPWKIRGVLAVSLEQPLGWL